jgi:hypothetical protein
MGKIGQTMNHFQFWASVATYYGRTIPDMTLQMYAEDTLHLDVFTLNEKFKKYRKQDTFGKMPLPSQLLGESVDFRSVANEIARKIDKAVFDFGYVWEGGYFDSNGNRYWLDKKGNRYESFKAAFVSELGEQAWKAVNSRGGWTAVAQSSNEMEEGMFIAQLRDQVQSQMLLEQKGVDVTKISFEKKEEIGEGAKLIDGLAKKLGMPE